MTVINPFLRSLGEGNSDVTQKGVEVMQARRKSTVTGIGSTEADLTIVLIIKEPSAVPVLYSLLRLASHLTEVCARLWSRAGLHLTELKGKQCEPMTTCTVYASLAQMF